MAKDPGFVFYPNDFEGGTRHMTDAEVGCYMRLLMAQFNRGGVLPADENFLSRFCTSFKESWPIVQEKFTDVGNGLLQNQKLQIETQKRRKFIEHQSDNGKKGGRPKTQIKPKNNPNESEGEPKANPLGNGNGNGINSESLGKGGRVTDTVGGWNTKPSEDQIDLELPEMKVGAVQQLFTFAKNTNISVEQVQALWRIFKLQNFNGTKYYQEPSDVFTHFVNWSNRPSINLKTIENGTKAYQRTSSNKSAGAETLLGILKDEITTNKLD